MSVFCIIPARGGSKGVPQKNIRSFLGRPLIEHSIAYARSADQVDRVFVSTDDDQIADISSRAGADIIVRPAELSGDTASTESAISHAIKEWQGANITPDIIVLLQATSPLRPEGSLDTALKHFVQEDFDSLLSISPTHRFFWQVKGREAEAMYDYMHRPRRQDMKESDKRFIENGSVYIFTTDHFKKTGNRLGGKIGYTIFPEDYSLEIDSLHDFKLLEELATKMKQ
ncbi:MAG: acylneuraminate cytidylyltransferase family protein [Candidatus Marinimicrobia bacterium]|nr:acylneuraminate cytidylyltransferase family protein [Candidatus Neomarinimicrobiota bacterium]